MSSVQVSPERYVRRGTLALDAFAGMKTLKFASRFPSTVDFRILSTANNFTRRDSVLTLNLYLVNSPSKTLLVDNFSRAIAGEVVYVEYKGLSESFDRRDRIEMECGDGEILNLI